MKQKIKKILPCYYGFFTNGMMVLLIGSILPYLIVEARISYSVAGGFLSAMALGNLLASFIVPPLIVKLKRRIATILLSSLLSIFLFVITLIPPVPVIYTSFLLIGIGRGTVSIVNNTVANENGASAAEINLLHTMFAIGAFLAPFLTVLYSHYGLGWKAIIYTIIFLTIVSSTSYYKLPPEASKKAESRNHNETKKMVKNFDFIIVSLILFFYLGVENCVNGWFVTYFKSSGFMSDAYATNLVSITWFLIMVGRLFNAYMTTKISKQKLIFIDCICAIVFFLMLISTKNLTFITIAVAGLGFFFAGIYPLCIADAGVVIKGSTEGMSLLLAIAALGGIITPQIVGIIADNIGIIGAIGFLVVNITLMVIFALINVIKHKLMENE